VSSRGQLLERSAALPEAQWSYPFGEDTAVFKVGGKIFALVDLAGEHGQVTVKADPDYAAALLERHPQVSPGYHMNKRHWITVDLSDTSAAPLPDGLLTELLEDSYAVVVAALPVRLRPLLPARSSRSAAHRLRCREAHRATARPDRGDPPAGADPGQRNLARRPTRRQPAHHRAGPGSAAQHRTPTAIRRRTARGDDLGDRVPRPRR